MGFCFNSFGKNIKYFCLCFLKIVPLNSRNDFFDLKFYKIIFLFSKALSTGDLTFYFIKAGVRLK